MLQSKVTNLGAPSQEECVEGDHRWDITDADVRYMNASESKKKLWNECKLRLICWSNLSNVNSSSMFKSQAIYSSAASVILGHHDKSRARSFWRFSAINSTPSSVILLQPDKDKTVKCGSEWTAKQISIIKMFSVNKVHFRCGCKYW